MRIKKIVVAVDPFSEDPVVNAERVVRSVFAFTKKGDSFVDAVYVMTPSGVGLPLEKFPEYQDHYKSVATDILRGALSGPEKQNVSTKITILPQGANSLRASVESLLKYVKQTGGDLVALSTHARKGVDRFFLGSFAESLVLKTTVPLLISNPGNPSDPDFRHILFATDFAEGSNEAFESVLSIASQLAAKVTVFHRLDPENILLPPSGFLAVEEWRARKIDRQAKALKLKERADKKGIPVEIHIDMGNHRVAPAILEASVKNKVSLIAIGARASSDFLAMGSTPRQIIRGATCPVLVLPTLGQKG